MNNEVVVTIRNGNPTFIYTDALASLCEAGKATITRASHVEPAADGGWTADMSPSNGPVLGPYRTRQEALDAEVEWLHQHLGV